MKIATDSATLLPQLHCYDPLTNKYSIDNFGNYKYLKRPKESKEGLISSYNITKCLVPQLINAKFKCKQGEPVIVEVIYSTLTVIR